MTSLPNHFSLSKGLRVSAQSRYLMGVASAVLLAWELLGWVMRVKPSTLPTPSRILLEIWQEGSRLQQHGLLSCKEILTGLLLATLLAISFAYLVALFPGIHRLIEPPVFALRRLPLAALTPVFVIWSSSDVLPKILTACLLAFFPIAKRVIDGSKSGPAEMPDLFRTMGATGTQFFFKLSLPLSLPGFFRGLREAVMLAIVGATVGEFVAADRGLGYLMLSGVSKMDTPLVFASFSVLAAVGLALLIAVNLLERSLIPWHIEITSQTVV